MDGAAFIRANTKLLPVPLVPEIRLHLAEESLPIWRKTEEELGEMNVPPPYWAFAWAGGQALARYILDNPATVAGARVLDLGSGSGLIGDRGDAGRGRARARRRYRCSRAGGHRPQRRRQRRGCRGDTGDLLAGAPGRFDIVLVGDLFYERTLAERVLAFIEAASATAGDSGRRSAPQLLSQGSLRAGRGIRGTGDARAGRRRDQAHRRVALPLSVLHVHAEHGFAMTRGSG